MWVELMMTLQGLSVEQMSLVHLLEIGCGIKSRMTLPPLSWTYGLINITGNGCNQPGGKQITSKESNTDRKMFGNSVLILFREWTEKPRFQLCKNTKHPFNCLFERDTIPAIPICWHLDLSPMNAVTVSHCGQRYLPNESSIMTQEIRNLKY